MKRILIIILLLLPFIIFLLYFSFFTLRKPEKTTTQTTLPTQTTVTTTTIPSPYIPVPIIETPGKNEIFIYADKIEPKSLEIKLGEVITFINKDTKTHVLTFSSPPLTKNLPTNSSWPFHFSQKGSYSINDETNGISISVTVS
jgi:plastocyanin